MQNLPVNPHQVDTSWFIRNVPQQHPFRGLPPGLQVPASFGQGLDLILGLFVMHVQNASQQNAACTFYANMVSSNNWVNPIAEKSLNTLFDIVDFALNTEHGNPQQVADNATYHAVRIMTALVASDYQQQLAPYLTPPQAQDLNAALMKFQDLRQQIQMYHQRGAPMRYGPMHGGGGPIQQMNMGYNGGYNAGPTGWQQQHMMAQQQGNLMPAVNPGMYASRHPMPDHRANGVGGIGNVISRFTTHVTQGEPTTTAAAPTNANMRMPMSPRYLNSAPAPAPVETPAAPVMTAISGEPKGPTVVVTKSKADRVVELIDRTREVLSIPDPNPQMIHRTQSAVSSDGVTVTDVNDPLREFILPSGVVVQDATRSTWKPARTDEAPYRVAYNKKRFSLYYTRNPETGVVSEYLQPKEDSAVEQYVEHELNDELRGREEERLRAKGDKIGGVEWKNMLRLDRPADRIVATTIVDEGAAGDTLEETAKKMFDAPLMGAAMVIEADNAVDGLDRALANEPEMAERAKTEVVEVNVKTSKSYNISEASYHHLTGLQDAVSYRQLVKALREADEQQPEDRAFWDLLDDRLTARVNRLLNINLSIVETIESFCSDAVELKTYLAQTYGENVAETYSEQFASIVETALGFETPGADGDEVLANEDGTITIDLVNLHSVTSIPYTLEELDIGMSGVSVVSDTTYPELHLFLAGIMHRTQDLPVTFSSRRIRTSDGVLLGLAYALLTESSYLLY